MAKGQLIAPAPQGGVHLTGNPRALPLDMWTQAQHIRFQEWRARRWPGYTAFSSGIVTPVSAESVLKIFDFARNASNRHLIVITTKHIYHYVSTDDDFYPIDDDNGVFSYNTGTVTTTSTGVTGAGGADFVAGGVAVHDIIQVTNLATPDAKFRVVTAVTDATHLVTAPVWGTLEAGRTYQIYRPHFSYTLAERPWAVSYLAELFIGALNADILYWDGSAVQCALFSAHAGFALPSGGTRLRSRDAFIADNHLMLVHTDIGGAATEPQSTRWSDIGEVADFDNTVAGSETGALGISDTNEDLVAGAKLGQANIVYARDGIHALSYVGYPFVFVRRQLSANFGLFAREALAVLNDRHLFIGTDDFYELSEGRGIVSIGEEVRVQFFSEVDRNAAYMISSTIDEVNSEWIISYKSTSGTGSFPNKLLIFNYRTRAWSTGTSLGWTALGRAKLQDQLGQQTINSISTDVKDYIQTYDGNQTGGLSFIALAGNGASESGSKLVQFAATSTLTSLLERTGLRIAEDPEAMQLLTSLKIAFDLSGSSGSVRVSFGSRDSQDVAYTWTDPQTYAIGSSDGIFPLRLRGREFGLRIETTSALGVGTFAVQEYSLAGEVLGDR